MIYKAFATKFYNYLLIMVIIISSKFVLSKKKTLSATIFKIKFQQYNKTSNLTLNFLNAIFKIGN